MTTEQPERPELQLTDFHRTLLSQMPDEAGTTLGPIASNAAHACMPTSRKRHNAVREGLITLEGFGLIETIGRNPRLWRITPAGRAARSRHA